MIRKVIEEEIKKLEQIKQKMVAEQIQRSKKNSDSERSRLQCKKVRGHFRYYINSKYVSKKNTFNQISELAKAEYQEKALPIIEREIRYLKLVLKNHKQLQEVYSRMNEGKQILFCPEIVPINRKIEDFENVIYKGLEFDESNQTEYITNRGERVRSKETLINSANNQR